MKLEKSGYYKNKGFSTLLNSTILSGKPGGRGVPTWQAERSAVFVRVKGLEGQSTYDYDLTLTGEELAAMVECALAGCSNERAMQAQAKAVGALVREALNPKYKPQESDD